MVLKKVDNRIRVLIENGVQKKQRSLFVVVGDKGKDQVSCTISTKEHFIYILGAMFAVCKIVFTKIWMDHEVFSPF